MTQQKREHWGSKLGFIMATAGSAIGLGSLWRFPYVASQNGGGAFILLYFIFILFIGIPLFMSELIIGRTSQKSSVKAFSDLNPKSNHWRLLGWFNLLIAFIILSYYSVVSGWTINYAFMSLVQFTQGKSPEEIKNLFNIMYASGDINIFWHLIFMLMTTGVVYSGIRKGIEYWSKILTPALLVILVVLFIFSTTLPGFKDAIKFIFIPDFKQLPLSGILDALGMSFFTLSVGIGIILTYGSYMHTSADIPKTSFIIGAVSSLVSLFATLIIFPIIFTFGQTNEGGLGLIFQTLPILFSKLPATLIISTVFFILFIFTALTSSISLLEVLVANLIEVFNFSRKKAVIVAGTAAFILGIPTALSGSGALFSNWKQLYGQDFFSFINYITSSWMMPISGFLTVLFIGWSMNKKMVKEGFLSGTSMGYLFKIWFFLIKWVVPVAVFLIILEQGGLFNLKSLFNK